MPSKSGFLKIIWIIIISSAFTLYIISVPTLTGRFVPCLKMIPGISYPYQSCNSSLILDYFMTLSLIGFAVSIFLLFGAFRFKSNIKNTPQKTSKFTGIYKFNLPILIVFIFISLNYALFIIFSYYRFMPLAMKAAKNAPIILESLKNK